MVILPQSCILKLLQKKKCIKCERYWSMDLNLAMFAVQVNLPKILENEFKLMATNGKSHNNSFTNKLTLDLFLASQWGSLDGLLSRSSSRNLVSNHWQQQKTLMLMVSVTREQRLSFYWVMQGKKRFKQHIKVLYCEGMNVQYMPLRSYSSGKYWFYISHWNSI